MGVVSRLLYRKSGRSDRTTRRPPHLPLSDPKNNALPLFPVWEDENSRAPQVDLGPLLSMKEIEEVGIAQGYRPGARSRPRAVSLAESAGNPGYARQTRSQRRQRQQRR